MGRAARPHYSTGQRRWVGAVCWFSAVVALIDACPPTLRFRVHRGQRSKGKSKEESFRLQPSQRTGQNICLPWQRLSFLPLVIQEVDGERKREGEKEYSQNADKAAG